MRRVPAVWYLCLSALFFFVGGSAARAQTYFRSDSASSLSVGGSSLFLDGELLSIFRNPAGFSESAPLQAMTELTFFASGPVRDVASVVAEGIYGNAASVFASSAVQSILENVYAGLGIVGPVGIGIIGEGIALGVFNDTDLQLYESSPLTLTMKMRESLVIAGGFSFRLPFPAAIPGSLYGGSIVKGIVAGEFEKTASYLQIPEVLSSVSSDALAAFPFSMITGFGLNGGIEYRHGDKLNIRIMAEDFVSGVRIFAYDTYGDFSNGVLPSDPVYERLPLQLHAGASLSPSLGRVGRYMSNLSFYFEYADMLDFLTRASDATNPVLHVLLGMDCEIMEVIHIRGGMGQGLLSAGIGIDLSALSINAAVYGRELGSQPGTRPVFGAAAGISIRR